MNQDFQIICINAPEGCRHGTHTNGTAYIRGTYSRVHTQTHTNTHKHKQTHNVARQSTARTHAVAAPSSSEVSGITTDSTLSTFFSPFPYC
jgi:hypothetical protein